MNRLNELEYYYNAFTSAKSLYLYYHYKAIFEDLILEYESIER